MAVQAELDQRRAPRAPIATTRRSPRRPPSPARTRRPCPPARARTPRRGAAATPRAVQSGCDPRAGPSRPSRRPGRASPRPHDGPIASPGRARSRSPPVVRASVGRAQGLDPEAGQDRGPQGGQEERPGRDPEPVHPRDDLEQQGEQAESGPRRRPPPATIRTSQPRTRARSGCRATAIAARTSGTGRSRGPSPSNCRRRSSRPAPRGVRAEQLEEVERVEVIVRTRLPERQPAAAQGPALRRHVGDQLDRRPGRASGPRSPAQTADPVAAAARCARPRRADGVGQRPERSSVKTR